MENSIPVPDLILLVNELEKEDFSLPNEFTVLTCEQWANILESLTNHQRLRVWPVIKPELASGILSSMREDARNQLVSQLSQHDVEDVITSGENVEVIEILDVLPKSTAAKLINKLSPESQGYIETSLSFNDSQVGRYANPNVFTINNQVHVKDILDEIKTHSDNNEAGVYLVVDNDMQVLGDIKISTLLSADENKDVHSLLTVIDPLVFGETSLLDASNILQASKRNYLPVVTEENKLIGIFSLHDAIDVFQDYYEAEIAHMGKVSDEDLFAPILISSRRRAVWLGINLITAFMASIVIGLFDKVLIEVVALAVLMPIVASMGGITGSQTLTLSIRGLATGKLNDGNSKLLRSKEIQVSLLNGFLWSAAVAAITWYWFDNSLLSFILALSLIINMVVAAIAGVLIPVTLDKLGIDPALAGSVILTTVTDVVGFFVFLGGASILFLN